MEAGTLSLKKIFGQDRRHVVPLFQRPYVWKRDDQWAPLWDDVRGLAERLVAGSEVRPHFLGAVVLDFAEYKYGDIETRIVIDGQQRLTTIQLMLEAFADIAVETGLDKVGRSLVKLTRNDEPMTDDPDSVYKVWPTNQDRECFRRVMDRRSPAEVLKDFNVASGATETGQSIADCYLFFHRQVEEWLGSDGHRERRAEALLESLRELVRMVVIELGEKDDAQLIFETLNARGTPLGPADLVKNYLFHVAQIEGVEQGLQGLYDKYWKPFEQEGEYWRRLVGRGHASRERLDTFLAHYLTLKERDVVPLAHLYSAFKAYATKRPELKSEDHLKELSHYARVFRGFDWCELGTDEQVFFERLGLLDITTVTPFLLELFARYRDDRDRLRRMLRDLESFLVRRTICKLSTRTYGRLFAELTRVFDSGDAETELRAALLASEGEIGRWPDDEEFRQAWVTGELTRSQTQAKVRMFLEAIERQQHTVFTGKVIFQEKLTIEHILPRAWRSGGWPLPDSGDADARDHLLHTIGNLTLLSGKLNPKVSNGPWESKRKAMGRHAKLIMNRDLTLHEEWNEGTIRARSAQLFKEAVNIWPHPGKPAEVAGG